MRLIQTLVPEGKHDVVIEVIEEAEIDYAMTSETSGQGYSDILYIPAESDDVEEILDELRDVGVEREGYMVVTDVETIVSERFEEQNDDEEADEERISREELSTKAHNLSRSTPNYIIFTVVSAVVATAGLLEDSAAIVVGSMVIAPLIGPAMASCVGTVVNDNELFWAGIRSQALGIVVAVLSATLFAFSYRLLLVSELDLLLIQQVVERVHPGLLSLAVALGAGIAGALSLTSGADEALVGVMIAVALIPPAASVGLGIGYADPVVAGGAGILVLVNVLSINAAGIITIWSKRYRPTHWFDERQARRDTIQRFAAFILVILVLSSFLAVSSLDARDNAVFETTVQTEIESTVDGNVLSVEFNYQPQLLSQSQTGVVVHVNSQQRGLADDLQTAIEAETGKRLDVTVVYEDAEQSDDPGGSSGGGQ
jgi:uncharacterized hydrophobic protein (TIGR00341 family)